MATFSRTGRLSFGYNRDQVDRFFSLARAGYQGGATSLTTSQVRRIGFDLVRGGYEVDQVDNALDRLEDALGRREREMKVAAEGEDRFFERLRAEADKLAPILSAPRGARFNHPERGERGYSVREVDRLVDRLIRYFDGLDELATKEVRTAVFDSARGKNGYRETSVDVFLDKVIELMVLAD